MLPTGREPASRTEVDPRVQASAEMTLAWLTGDQACSVVTEQVWVDCGRSLSGDPAPARALVALMADSPVVQELAWMAGADPRARASVDLVQVGLTADPAGSVLMVQVSVDCGPVLLGDSDQASDRDGLVRVSLARPVGPADCQVRTAGDCTPADSPAAAGDSRWDDNASCRDIPADSPKQSAVDDTKVAAGDKDSTILPNTRGCNTRGALPSSIPIRPSPRAGYRPVVRQSRFPLRS